MSVGGSEDVLQANLEHGTRWLLRPPRLVRRASLPRGRISSLAMAADGSWVAAASDHFVLVYECATGRRIHKLAGRAPLVLGPQGEWLLSAADGTLVEGLERKTGAPFVEIVPARRARRLRDLASFGTFTGGLLVAAWNTADPTQMPRYWLGHRDQVLALAVDAHGFFAASCSQDGTLRLWCIATGQLCGVLSGAETCQVLAFTANGRAVIYLDGQGSVRLWHFATDHVEAVRVLAEDAGSTLGMALSSSGDLAARVARSCWVQIWDVARGQVRAAVRLSPPLSGVLAFSSDGAVLAVGGASGEIWIIDVALGLVTISMPTAHRAAITALAFDRYSRRLTSTGMDGRLMIWEPG